MTIIPPAADSPDFSPETQWTAAPLVYETGNLSADKVYPLTYVGNYGALSILALNLDAAVGWQLTVTWYADAAGAEPIDGTTFHTNSGKLMAGALANRGPFVAITLNATDYTVPRAYKLIVYPRLGAAEGSGPLGNGVLLVSTAAVVNAGATTKIGQGALATFGSVALAVNGPATGWRAVVLGEDQFGATAEVVCALDPGNGRAASEVGYLNGHLPAVWINNYSAGNITFQVGLNALV